jgi:hypothetical protein
LDSSKFSQGKNLSSKNNSGDIKVINVNNVEQCVNASQAKRLSLLDNAVHGVKGHSSTIDHNLQKCLKCLNYFDCVCLPCSNNCVSLNNNLLLDNCFSFQNNICDFANQFDCDIFPPPHVNVFNIADDYVNSVSGGFDILDHEFDHCFCDDYYLNSTLDFNVNDIFCKLKFNFNCNFVNNCSACNLSIKSNIHHNHHSFGYFNHSSFIISSNIPGFPITPTFSNYLAVQSLYNGSLNFISKIAPIASHINVDLFRELVQGFHDQQIFDLIKYGFPLDLDKSSFIQNLALTNHGSALQFPAAVDNYFSTEINLGSIFSPFSDPPLQELHCSPRMTAPKDGSGRRIIVNLSYPSPQQQSVNILVSKTTYVGTPFQLKLPTIDNICQVLNSVGKNIKNFKVDLARAFRQLYLDPFDIKYLGLRWRKSSTSTSACRSVIETVP